MDTVWSGFQINNDYGRGRDDHTGTMLHLYKESLAHG